ncbi:splicing factor 3B subunit 1-like [Dorcoceras hygrometricum]|uniref:Splicing factor 3B subunit 1-like n=1 Tax=Dorcoceras hygrometricum TaxID=472368 RepID=A0A2Z7AAH4_9LAMI|nr:splicing factor 3B subunit 1-like [Dorcoceras hygrometricum]
MIDTCCHYTKRHIYMNLSFGIFIAFHPIINGLCFDQQHRASILRLSSRYGPRRGGFYVRSPGGIWPQLISGMLLGLIRRFSGGVPSQCLCQGCYYGNSADGNGYGGTIVTRSDGIVFEDTECSGAVNDVDDNLDGTENEISRKMTSFTAPKQLLQEPLKSGEDDDMSGFKQPSKIIDSAETEETDIEPVDTEELSLAKMLRP